MDGISAVLAGQQTAVQGQIGLTVAKMAAENARQLATVLAEAVARANPDHLGQTLDTHA